MKLNVMQTTHIMVALLVGMWLGMTAMQMQQKGLDQLDRRIVCDIEDVLDQEHWTKDPTVDYPAWTVHCSGYSDPGFLVIVD